MRTVIINGANGYVASNFINNLLKQHYRVIALVRAHNQDPEVKMKEVLAHINDGKEINTSNLEVYNYSLFGDNFSMNENILKSIFTGNVHYFHFAASLKYDEKSVDEIFSTNIGGVENSIKVFSKYAKNDSHFFYIGTAYSCGRFSGLFEEKFYENEDISAFRNYYEQSKRFAENIVGENIRNNGLNGHIIRLSQVIGNQKTGVTKTDYGIFDFAKRVYKLAKRYPDEIVRVHVDPEATQNLIPIDTVTGQLIKVVEENEIPEIMNFVSKNPIRNGFIIDTLNRLVPIQIIPIKNLERNEMNPIERMISAGMSFTESYASINVLFDTRQRNRFLKNTATGPDYKSIAKMMGYFIETLSEKKQEHEVT